MPTIDDLKREEDEYASAYAEEPGQQDVPEAEGAEDLEASDGDAANDTGAEMGEPEQEKALEEQEAPGEAEQDANEAQELASPAARDPKDIQREKSWEGRLRAREEQLKAREAALAERERATTGDKPAGGLPQEPAAQEAAQEQAEGQAEEQAEESTEDQRKQEDLENAADAVQAGRMTVDEAVKTLSSDFGEEFAQTLSVLIEAKAREVAATIAGDEAARVAEERAGKVKTDLDSFMENLNSERARAHFEAIADAHPDFMEMAQSQEMKDYLAGLDEEKRAEAERIAQGGTTRQVIKLLNAVKKASAEQQPAQEDESMSDALADAEGVRSKGMSIPKKPTMADDYESAWSQF